MIRPISMLARLSILIFALGICVSAKSASASGYHPNFDRAVQEAEWIVQHEVLSEHAPAAKLANLSKNARGQVFLVRVKRSFKGPLKPGDELLIWGPSNMSSATYSLSGTDNLTFLVPPTTQGQTATAIDGHTRVGRPIRNLSQTTGRGSRSGIKGWIRLLDMTKVGQQAITVAQIRKVLSGVGDRGIYMYALTHWTQPISKADAALIRRVVANHMHDAYVSSPAIKLLRANGYAMATADLVRMLKKGSTYGREDLLKEEVQAKNIIAVRGILWKWILRDEQGAIAAIATLARLQPNYLEKKLRAHHLPFWLDIPALNAISKKAIEMGRQPFPAWTEKVSPWELVDAGKLVKGKTFGAWYGMKTRDKKWRRLMPLVVPHLPTMKDEARELAIGVMRSWGNKVQRQGTGVVVGPQAKPPLTLVLQTVPGSQSKVLMIEKASSPILLCAEGGKSIELKRKGGGSTSTDNTSGTFSRTNAPKGCFKTAKGVRKTEIIDLASLMKNVSPGRHKLRVSVLHPHGGVEHGLDAWTGMVYSNEIEIVIR